jgi:hypothetical protein
MIYDVENAGSVFCFSFLKNRPFGILFRPFGILLLKIGYLAYKQTHVL